MFAATLVGGPQSRVPAYIGHCTAIAADGISMDDQKNTAALHGLNWQVIVVGLLVVAVIAIAGALAFAWRIGSIAREQLIETLQTRFSSDVELHSLRVLSL